MKPVTKKMSDYSAPEPTRPVFTHTCMGTFKNINNGEWYTVEVEVDPVTETAGKVSVKPINAQDRGTAQEAFKLRTVEVVEAFMMS